MVPDLLATGSPWVANQLGYFKKLGLNVQFVYSGSGPSATRAWLAGDADLNAGSVLNLPSLSDQGIDYEVVGGVANSAAYQVLERKGLNAPSGNLAALKGKKMCSIGTFVDSIFRGLAAQAGIPQSSMNLIELASFPAVAAALQQGQCDFTVATSPFTQQMVSQGAKVWINLASGPPAIRDIPNIAIVGKKSWVQSHQAQVRALDEGIAEVTKRAHTDPKQILSVAASVVKPPSVSAYTSENAATIASWSPQVTAKQINYVNHLLVDIMHIAKAKPDPRAILWPGQTQVFAGGG